MKKDKVKLGKSINLGLWKSLSSVACICCTSHKGRQNQDDQTRVKDRFCDSVTLLATLQDGGLDYEWPGVRVVMGGWGLGGSNGESIETKFNCCRYKKRTKRLMRKHMRRRGWQHIILNDRSLVLASWLQVPICFLPIGPFSTSAFLIARTVHMPCTHKQNSTSTDSQCKNFSYTEYQYHSTLCCTYINIFIHQSPTCN